MRPDEGDHCRPWGGKKRSAVAVTGHAQASSAAKADRTCRGNAKSDTCILYLNGGHHENQSATLVRNGAGLPGRDSEYRGTATMNGTATVNN